MRKLPIVLIVLGVFAPLSTQAQAKGCLKGAFVGGVAGHYAGHHAIAGAIGGCAIGHHMAKKAAASADYQA